MEKGEGKRKEEGERGRWGEREDEETGRGRGRMRGGRGRKRRSGERRRRSLCEWRQGLRAKPGRARERAARTTRYPYSVRTDAPRLTASTRNPGPVMSVAGLGRYDSVRSDVL